MNLGLARLRFALSALAWMGDPSALPAMKVCLFSNPGLWTTGRHQKGPHRRCFKASSDRRLAAEPTGLVTSRVPSRYPRHSRIGGRPQARATLGKRDIGTAGLHNQLKSCARLEKMRSSNNAARHRIQALNDDRHARPPQRLPRPAASCLLPHAQSGPLAGLEAGRQGHFRRRRLHDRLRQSRQVRRSQDRPSRPRRRCRCCSTRARDSPARRRPTSSPSR